jgi:signal transduction histidine kinase
VIADDGQVERVAVLVADPAKQHLVDRIRQFVPARDSKTPQAETFQTGHSVLHERFPPKALDGNRSIAAAEMGVHSVMTVPLVARGRTFGSLTFGATTPGRNYSASDLAVAEEIGRRAAIAVDNAQLYERAQRATQARQDLLAMVSHDLKNPLNTILMSTSLLDTTTPGQVGEIQKTVGMIRRSAHRMNRLLGDLLDIASLESGHLTVDTERHPVAPLVHEAFELQRAVASSKELVLEEVLQGADVEIDCDRGRILQVFGNLIGNAIKFTRKGGSLRVGAEARAEEVLFSVADSGPGIEPDELPHVFDRFWQARKTARMGTGLGLTIAKGLVEAHHGRIWVESTLGKGATFFFTVPVVGRVSK